MRPSPFPDWLEDVWAKSPEKGEGGQAESLAQHTWAVLERLAGFIRLRPTLPSQLRRDDLWHLLYWAVFFHDFGKVIPAFQEVLHRKNGAKEKWQKHRHEVFSLAFLNWVTDGLAPEQLQWVRAAVLSHHRDPDEISSLYPPLEEGEEDPLTVYLSALDEDKLLGLWQWLDKCSAMWIDILGLSELGVYPIRMLPKEQAVKIIKEIGAQTIRSHLRNYRRFVDKLLEEERILWINGITLRGYIINADHGGSAHAEPLPAVRFSARDVIESRNIQAGALFSHQRQAGEIKGSALLIAPTGSGKTEAALLWAANQEVEGRSAPRLFYTLPYQASMNAMYLRLQETFGTKNVGLQHGRSLLALYRQLMERDYTSPQDAARNARNMRNLAELNHPPVRVFSPYQMLKWMYRLKGYEAQLSDYHNSLFIFDEIHAYEVERLAMILEMIQYLRQYFNARFFVMSATFPSLIKNWLKEALGSPSEINAEPALFQEFQRHKLDLIDGDLTDDGHLHKIVDEARTGKSVLVVCNIVARAQQIYNTLKKHLNGMVPVELLHGRFNMRDRMKKEQYIREKTGLKSEQRSPIILVTTQVIEVSLDLDLDTIYTDPAPLEALIQRFGRVNRGRKIKPYAVVHVFTQPNDGQNIYDPALINGSLNILRRENGKPINESLISEWLDQIYAGEVAEEWKRNFTKAAKEFKTVCVDTLRPFETGIGLEELFYKAFDGIEVLPDSLLEEYLQHKDAQPIVADELLVPISWGRYKGLQSKGLIRPRDQSIPPVVLTNYSYELGLTYEAKPEPDDWK